MDEAWIDRLAEDFTRALGRPIATVQDAAELLGCAPATIREAIREGDLFGSRRVPKGAIRITARELARFLAAGRVSAQDR